MKQLTALLLSLIIALCALPGTANAAYYIGDTVTFGTYEQDCNWYNGQEPIEWRIIAMNGSSALLMSEYALDCVAFHKSNTNASWANCSLRVWLNEDFYDTAFTYADKGMIMNYSEGWGNVFILSADEVVKYLGSTQNSKNEYPARICYPTRYAISRGTKAYKSGYCWWWLRDRGSSGSNYAASVNGSGSINYGGDIIDGNHSDGSGVRPCVWVYDVYSLGGSTSVTPGDSWDSVTPDDSWDSVTPDDSYDSWGYDQTSYEYGLATMNLATRTGPATEYTEPGTFNLKGQYIKLISSACDSGGVTWLQCEITADGQLMRVYTGLKRFDQGTFSLWNLKTEQGYWYSTNTQAGFTPRMGPGNQYKAESAYIPYGAQVTIVTEEDGWLQFEYDTGIIKSGSATYILRAWAPSGYFR